MNYRSLTDGEKDVEESPSQCGPDQMDLASLARLAINPFYAEVIFLLFSEASRSSCPLQSRWMEVIPVWSHSGGLQNTCDLTQPPLGGLS